MSAPKRPGAPRMAGRASPLDQVHPPIPRGFPTGLPVPAAELLAQAFADLHPDLPLLLLPVRIETRYRLAANPPELRIRILPDQLHIDADSGRATLLPGQWLAVGYSADGVLFSQASRAVDPDLRTSPDPQAPPWSAPGSGVVTDEALAWMFDYDRAVEAGMAITVPLVGTAAPARRQVQTLLVVGIDSDRTPPAAAAELDRLLGGHARTSGLAFVAPGTPTNNTETATSGWSAATPDPVTASARERELDPHPAPIPGDNAARLASALGLAQDATLRRCAGGSDTERGRSRAMVRVTYEAVLGTFVRRLLRVGESDAIGSAAMDALRDWCARHVTGGAPYGTLRIGPQPYGILPVLRSTVAAAPSSTSEQVQAVISLLIDEWRRSAAVLPVLDPDRADIAGAGAGGDETSDASAAIAAILATQPHPQRLFVRRLDDFTELDGTGVAALSPQSVYLNLVLAGLSPETNPNLAPPYEDIGQLLAVASLRGPVETIDEQIALWQDVDDSIFDHMLETYPGDVEIFQYIIDSHAYIDAVLALLSSYEQRQRPVRWLDLDVYSGVLGRANTKLVEGILHSTSTEWGAEGLVQERDAPPGRTAATYLADLRDRFARRRPALPASTLHLDPEPLLYQLLDRTLALVPDDPEQERHVLDALDELAPRDPAELEWLLREALGLGSHRLDAWATSLATERLGRLRDARPTGIQVGAFGWVTGLEPRGEPRLSEGFVHAPSMAQASTAALLRSGWQAHGTDDPLSPVAVDLSSARVRSASWLLDGVRTGLELGALLGYRFERSLHDLDASELIRPVRQQVLVAAERPGVPPDEPVDGIALLDLYRAGGLEPVAGPLLTALEDIEGAFDAVNDAGLFEGVHQLATGNLERATAILDALGTGARRPPELRGPLTPRSGMSIEHRVLILLDPDASAPGRGWAGGIRDAAAPALEAWVGSLLPPATEVGFALVAAPALTYLTLGDLGLSALDALWLVGDDPAAGSVALRTLAAAARPISATTGSVEIDPTEPGPAPCCSLADFTVLALELRRALQALRVADARDLRPGAAPGGPDHDDRDAVAAVEALVSRFDADLERLQLAVEAPDGPGLAVLARRLARFGIATGAVPGDLAAGPGLVAAAQQRLAAVDQAGTDAPDRRTRAERRLAALLGGRMPLLGRFTVSAAPGGDVVDLSTGLATPDQIDDWLDALARVRPDLARLGTAGMLSEMISEDGGLRASAGQSPLAAGDRWAATGRPAAGVGGRLCVVAITGPSGPPVPGAAACGLVVDRWSEWIPSHEQVTGLAFHFDAPGNRPAQSMLLAVTPEGEPWSLDLVLDTLLETLEWASLRAVGPEDLLDYGRAVPTVFVPGNITAWPAERT